MTDEHRDALEAFLRVFDERAAAAPIMERRKAEPTETVEARRAPGPVDSGFAYWVSSKADKPR